MMKSLLLSMLVFTLFIGCSHKDKIDQNELQKVMTIENVILKDSVLDQPVKIKILSIAKEIKEKLNINMYVLVELDNGIDMNLSKDERITLLKNYNNSNTKNLAEPNIVLVLSVKQFYLDILGSNSIISKDKEDDILENYMIPILASKENNSMNIKINAAILNGFAKLADVLAEQKNLQLNSTNLVNH